MKNKEKENQKTWWQLWLGDYYLLVINDYNTIINCKMYHTIYLMSYILSDYSLRYSPNPHLASLESDHLYHLALETSRHDFREMFGDVRFVCVGGTTKRMRTFANFVGNELGIKLPTGVMLNDITLNAHRYSMFKIGPVLSVTVRLSSSLFT